MRFLKVENKLDLDIHRFNKPVVVFAHGITMGGGLGLSVGADIVAANETTRMAMPETRIGFFSGCGFYRLAVPKMRTRLSRIPGAYRI
jgi:enoyl-CoA hydratase/carnithine racemase